MPWNADKTQFTVPAGRTGRGQNVQAATYTADEWNAKTWQQKQQADPAGGWTGPNGESQASGDPFSVEGGGDQLLESFGKMANAFGFVPSQATENSPGARLNTDAADQERARIQTLIEQLNQQAVTGGGAWEGTLKDATDKASSSAQALGQSQPGVGYSSQLRNIGNAQGAVAQRAVGQGNILRAQSQQAATDQLTGLLGSTGEQDINQADASGKVNQGVRQLNSSLAAQSNKNLVDTLGAGAKAIATLSDGGPVPGRPEVFGDDERNDTVSAMLSPGEIVIPRSIARDPEAAADFVRAIMQRPQHFDEGGRVDPDSGLALGSVGQEFGSQGQAPSIENGGLLNRGDLGRPGFNQTREASQTNEARLGQMALGRGPSVAPQQMQNATDAQLTNALQAMAGRRGPAAGDIVQGTAGATQQDAGQAAATTAGEQQAGQVGLARAATQQRGQDLAMATAEQQAAWRNTQMNAGLGLAQQAQLRQITGSLGEAGAAYGSLDDPGDSSFDLNDTNTPDFDAGGSDPSEWDTPDFWSGGKVKKYASGGSVDQRGVDFVNALRRVGIR